MIKYLFVYCIIILGHSACNSVNQTTGGLTVKDSIIAINRTDTSILLYTEGLEKLKASFIKKESPVFTTGDYSFYFTSYQKDSSTVIYEEYGDSGDYGFNEKVYYLENGEIILYKEKLKIMVPDEKPFYEFRESRYFYRNGIFLKADEKTASSDSALNNSSFIKLDENLADSKKEFDFDRIQRGLDLKGEFQLYFKEIKTINAKNRHLILSNNTLSLDASYLIQTPDSLILQLEKLPEFYRGKKLLVDFKKEGKTKMIYQSALLAN